MRLASSGREGLHDLTRPAGGACKKPSCFFLPVYAHSDEIMIDDVRT